MSNFKTPKTALIQIVAVTFRSYVAKISMTLIEQTKAMEAKYSKSLDQFKVKTFDLDKEKTILNEHFRDVNLSIESIKDVCKRNKTRQNRAFCQKLMK